MKKLTVVYISVGHLRIGKGVIADDHAKSQSTSGLSIILVITKLQNFRITQQQTLMVSFVLHGHLVGFSLIFLIRNTTNGYAK